LIAFFEEGFYRPKLLHKILFIPLVPLSYLYCLISTAKKVLCKKSDPGVAVIGVGNLIVGGSGKTPLIKALAEEFEDVAVVTRGYKRKSKGVVQVSDKGEILCSVERSGDEAMELAKTLAHASVFVAEDRMQGIEMAKKEGARIVFLDDAFHHCIEKFDILIDVETQNPFCLPAGPMRLPRFFMKSADLVVREGRDFHRRVRILHPTKKMVLLTAIANPSRLDPYLPKGIKRYHFEDHHHFTKEELERIWKKENPQSFLVTRKDLVKLEKFGYPCSILDLQIELNPKIVEQVREYTRKFDAKEDSDRSDTA